MKAKFQEIQEFPILKRLEFPRFIGEDPEEWRCRAEEYFACYRTPDEHHVPLSTLYLEGKIREMEWFRNIRFSKCAITWEEFVRTLRARIAVPAKEESLERVKDEEEEQRDEETNLLEETDPVATTYHEKREEKKSTDDAHYTLISATEPDEDTTPIQNSDPDEVEKREKIILRPDPIEDTTNPAKEPAEDPKHAKITAADPVDDAYHLFDEIPPRISESFLERPFPDPAVPNVIILVAINHTVSSLVPQNSYEDGVDFLVLKHRWRWKEDEDTTRAGRGGRHCCRRSRARQGTGGPRSRAMGRRLGPVPMLSLWVLEAAEKGEEWSVWMTKGNFGLCTLRLRRRTGGIHMNCSQK